MGLTITGYCCLEAIESPRLDTACDPLDSWVVRFRDAPHYPEHSAGLDTSRAYRFLNTYEFDVSYVDFEIWREQLAKFAGYPAVKKSGHVRHVYGAQQVTSGPFRELLDFSMTEGTIGPKVSRKLCEDFDRFMVSVPIQERRLFAWLFKECYLVFSIAQHDGAVKFH